ncbi:MAG: glycosyltransferase family 39 protein [Anaerolineae bacterium]|nr:glycosyltransferase family 39 protein [Anaerolineae bacterium]
MEQIAANDRERIDEGWWVPLLLAAILMVGGYLRFTNLKWDDYKWIHPDESHMQQTLSKIHTPDSGSLLENVAIYFDTRRSPLNVRNQGDRYSYGTLPLFIVRFTAEGLDQACARLIRETLPASAEEASSDALGQVYEPLCKDGAFTGYRSKLVGRLLSASVDMGTILLVFLIGRRLYSEITGVLAAAFAALTAFLIQQAHFFTVDSMMCFLVTLTAYFAVRASQTGGWGSFALSGLSCGFAAACKVSGVYSSLLVALAGVVWLWSLPPLRRRWGLWNALLRLALAGVLCLIAFRIAQPYAFEGPGFFGVKLSPEWLDRLGQIRNEQTGNVNSYPDQQWTNRTPLLFPWVNIVFWGMGLPLGLTAWAGWAVMGLDLWRGKRVGKHLVVWGWTTLLFLYLGTQWVKSMRYFIYLYPLLAIMAAYLLARLLCVPARLWRVVGYTLTVVAIVGAALWGYAVFSIYLRQNTRIAAGQWMYDHIPSKSQFAVASEFRGDLERGILSEGLRQEFSRHGVHLSDDASVTREGPDGVWYGFWRIHDGNQTYIIRENAARGLQELTVYSAGSVVAYEHWDWGPHFPGSVSYPGLATSSDGQMQNYHDDTWEKRTQLFNWLDEADTIVISSNRIYASVSRLEPRYPLTNAYYRALFAGELGFELVADFTSSPSLFGLVQFPDQETPFPLPEPSEYLYQQEPLKVTLPPAEEAFSVYDHPRVLIFRKTDAYSRERVMQVLGGIDLDQAYHGLRPKELTAVPDLMEFDDETWAEQQAGGTWSEMFNSRGLFNRYPGLAALAWWLVVALLGWLAFPLLFVTLPRLRDRGYGLARMLALLVLAYMTWIAASVRVLPNTRETIIRMLLLLVVVGGGVGWLRREEIKQFVRRRRRLILVTEGIFALLYLLWIGVRLLQPDLWHVYVGGEKPMDFAYLNAVIKSTWFPPYNPWLSGNYINYYYFGFVIVGTLTKLMGTVPATAYNLMVPLLYALTGVGAFSVAYNLMGHRKRGAILAGVAAVVFTVVLGNLGVVHLLYTRLIEIGGVPFESTIPGFPEMVALFKGLWEVIAKGASLSIGNTTWYWHPTRIIPSEMGNPIEEFPAFTFLYADLHAHMIAFPLTLLALALALYWVLDSRPRWWSLVIGGLVVGSLRPTNTWDYYSYLLLGIAALIVGAWEDWRAKRRRDSEFGRMSVWLYVRWLILRIALFAGLSYALFLPYIRHYSGYSSLERWNGLRTPMDIFLWIHLILLFPVVMRLLVEVGRVFRWRKSERCRFVPRSSGSIVALWCGMLMLALFLIALLAAVMTAWKQVDHMTVALLDEIVPVALVALPITVLAAVLLFVPGMPPRRRFLWLMVGLAMSICVAIEVVVVKGDIGRQNTVFKFYLQVWILLSIAASVSVAWLYARSRRWQPTLRYVWWGAMALLVLGGALFLPLGIHARATNRISPDTGLTLDGMAFMKYSRIYDGPEGDPKELFLYGDYAAMRWMQDNIQGSPVIVEGLGWREYLWANRVSIYTGLPAVVGWRWHEVQQRPLLPSDEIDERRSAVPAFYGTTDINSALDFLKRYDVRYIYVGGYEQAYFDPVSLGKFDTMADQGLLRPVYDSHGVKIYEVPDGDSEFAPELQ